MDVLREVLEENAQLEALLGAAQDRIADLERELVAWRCGSKSVAAAKVEQRFSES